MIHVAADGVYQDGIKISQNIENAAWDQGMLEMVGVYQKRYDVRTCHACGHSYFVARTLKLYPGGGILADYVEAPDPGCSRCVRPEGK